MFKLKAIQCPLTAVYALISHVTACFSKQSKPYVGLPSKESDLFMELHLPQLCLGRPGAECLWDATTSASPASTT